MKECDSVELIIMGQDGIQCQDSVTLAMNNRQQNIDYTESNERSQGERSSPDFSRSLIRLPSAIESSQMLAS